MDGEDESEDYKKRRDEFVAKVFRFHERRGTPLKRLPMLGGRELNIYHLYEEVQKRGGSEKVTKVRMWGEIARTFNLPSTVTSASYAIRNHFIKLLEHFEAAEHGLPLPPLPSPSPSLPPLPILPFLPKPLLPTRRAAIPTHTPSSNMTSETDLGLSKLTRSLLSGLPNEVDFAFNILLILTNSNALPVHKTPSLLDIILAHVAIFSDDDPGLEDMYRETWYPESELDFVAFWEAAVPEWVYVFIINAPIRKSMYECLLFNTGSLLLRGEALSPMEEGVEGLRAGQVATILSNFSTDESSARELAESSGVLRFLVLAMSCYLPSIRIPGLDCLANIASSLQLDYDPDCVDSPAHVMAACLHQCVLSDDRFTVKRGIEILGKLAWSPVNSPFLLSTPPRVFHRILETLLLPDCEMTMTSLDALYSLSLFGREVAESIAAVRGLLESLVRLLAFRVEDLPPGSLSRIKLYFIGDSSSLAQYLADIQAKSATPTSSTHSSSTQTGVGSAFTVARAGTVVKGVVASPLATNQIRSKPAISPRVNSPLTTVQVVSRSTAMSVTTQPSSVETSASSLVSLSQSLIKSAGRIVTSNVSGLYSILSRQSQTGSQRSPKEDFAIEWLKQTYEVNSAQHLVLLVDIYAQYILHSSSKGKKDFLNNSEFLKVIRQVFPATEQKEVRTVSKKVIQFLTGLRRIPPPQKTTSPLTNHTPSPTPPTGSSTTAPPTGSAHSLTQTASLNSHPTKRNDSPTAGSPSSVSLQSSSLGQQLASFGLKSSSVSLRSSSLGSHSVSDPHSSLTPSISSTPASTSAASSRDSSPAVRVSPDITQERDELPSQQAEKLSRQSPERNATQGTPPLPRVCETISQSDVLVPTPSEYSSRKSSPDSLSDLSYLPSKAESHLSNSVPMEIEQRLVRDACSTPSLPLSPLSSGSHLSRGRTPDSIGLANADSNDVIVSKTTCASSFNTVDSRSPTEVHLWSRSLSTPSSHITHTATPSLSTPTSHITHTPTPSLSTLTSHITHTPLTITDVSRNSLPSAVAESTQSHSTTNTCEREQPLATLTNTQTNVNNPQIVTTSSDKTRPLGDAVSFTVSSNTPKRPKFNAVSLKSSLELNNLDASKAHESRNLMKEGSIDRMSDVSSIGSDGCSSGGFQGMDCSDYGAVSRTKRSVDQRSISVEPVLLASSVSSAAADRNRQTQSLPPNVDSSAPSDESVPEAKRIRLTSPLHNSKQQQQQTSQQMHQQISLEPISHQRQNTGQHARQTSYTTSSIQFVNKSPVVTNTSSVPVSNPSNKSQTSSNNSVRPVCLWENCMSMRYSWRDLLHHAVTSHISPLPSSTPSQCHWAGCTTGPMRMKPSLIRHVETHHCSPGPKPNPPSVAATLAKLKHCPPLENEFESPLTKAIRVTAALVLRNLSREVTSTHQVLKRYEDRLCQMALSSSEASNTVSECLYYLNRPLLHSDTDCLSDDSPTIS